MKLSKGKIILIVIVVYFIVFAIINVNKEKDINKEILEKVVIVNDGKVDEKNNGKIVLVVGKISYDHLVTFDELEDGFGTIKINRKVEDFKKVEDEEKWVERKEPVDDNKENNYLNKIISEEKLSKVKIGNYNLDQHGLKLIPTDNYYTKQEKIGNLTTTGIFYARDPWEEDLKVGDIKLTYKYYDLNKNPYISVLAVQKDNTFKPYIVDKKTEVYQLFKGKVDTKKKLKKELKINVKKTVKGKTLFIIIIILIGTFLIIDNKKNKTNV